MEPASDKLLCRFTFILRLTSFNVFINMYAIDVKELQLGDILNICWYDLSGEWITICQNISI